MAVLTSERPSERLTQPDRSLITEANLDHLPTPVQRFMRFSRVVGTPWIKTVRLRYSGHFRMSPQKPWMPISVTQLYTTQPPTFLWKARFRMFGLPLMNAVDVYKDGHSRMHGKLLGRFTVVDGSGPEVLQGTMIRYLQEMTWFPSAYLYEYMTWQAVDDHSADVTFTDHGQSVGGRMYFDDEGRLLSFVAQRYGEFDKRYVIRTWATPATEYQPMAGLVLPIAGVGVWQLPDGDFPYVDIRIHEIAYNVPLETF